MKKILLLLGISATVTLIACKDDDRYLDLTSGEYIKIDKDDNGRVLNSKTKEPVYIYVDTKTHDTIYGATGKVINGYVVRTGEGKYKYDVDGEYKKKVDGDEVKIKDGDTKTKIEDGEKKVKKDD